MPTASNFASADQYKLRSAQHWNVIAQDAVEQTVHMMQTKNLAADAVIYVEPVQQASTFEVNFHEFLLTHLVRQGFTVQMQPSATALVLRYQTQTVVHKGALPEFIAGRSTALGAGIWALHGLRDQSLDTLMALPAVIGLGKDWLDSRSAHGPTHSEVVVTTFALHGEQYVSRYTDTYYIQDADKSLFGQEATGFVPRAVKVVNQ